jgi:hypothetical protein
MQRPIRAIAYGFAIWWVWFAFIGAATLLPDTITSLPSFGSARLLVLVLLVVFFAVDYLRRIGQGSVVEGLAVGLTWAVLMVANDIGHFLSMEPTDIGLYLTTFAPLYAWIPVATVIVFGRLSARPERTRQEGSIPPEARPTG